MLLLCSGLYLEVKHGPVSPTFTGLAFAVLSSVHPVFGLYGSLFPTIIYAIFGMGRHVATGNNFCLFLCFPCY